MSLNIGPKDSEPEWEHDGPFSVKETTQDLTDAFNSYLEIAPHTGSDPYGFDYVDVPINMTFGCAGSVRLTNLSVKYDWVATIDKNPRGNLADEINSIIESSNVTGGNITIPITVSSDSPGKVWLRDLRIEYNAAPVFKGAPEVQVYEDTAVPHALYLPDLWTDDITAPEEMEYLVVSNSAAEYVTVQVVDEHWLSVDATKTPDWNTEQAGGGVPARVAVSATDGGGRTVCSQEFDVPVLPVNDEPFASLDIPDITLKEGMESDGLNLDSDNYFLDVDNDTLYYTALVDPLDTMEGVGESLTATITGAEHELVLEALGDFNTEGGEPVPLWVFADDDPDINTHEHGWLDEGAGVRNCTYQEVLVTVNNTNDPPEWEDIPPVELNEDEDAVKALYLPDYASDIDNTSKELRYSLWNVSTDSLSVIVDDEGWVSVHPSENYNGKADARVDVTDGMEIQQTDFGIIVHPVNDAPKVNVTAPSDVDTVSGAVEFSGMASDVDGDPLTVWIQVVSGGSDVEPSPDLWTEAEGSGEWTYTWRSDTGEFPNGPYYVFVRSHDGSLYSGLSGVSVRLENDLNAPPTVTITGPEESALVSGSFWVSGTATDDVAVVAVEYRLNGQGPWLPVPAGTTGGFSAWSFSLNGASIRPGGLTITVKAFDGELYSEEATVDVTVVAGEDQPTDSGGESEGTSYDWLLAIVIIAIVSVIAVLLLIAYHRKKGNKDEDGVPEPDVEPQGFPQIPQVETPAPETVVTMATPMPSPEAGPTPVQDSGPPLATPVLPGADPTPVQGSAAPVVTPVLTEGEAGEVLPA